MPGYENYVIKGDISKSTWQEIIKSEKPDKLLPAYIKDTDGTLHYYKYSVTETEINGYTTTIKSSDDGFTFTIINRHFALLPDTGGAVSYTHLDVYKRQVLNFWDYRY